MNGNQDSHAIFLRTLGAINEALIEMAVLLRKRSGILGVVQRSDIRNYKTGAVFEAYVEAETQPTVAYCWWVDIRYDAGKWILERSIQKTTDAGQDMIREFPVRSFSTAQELCATADSLLQEFRSSAGELDLTSSDQ